MSFTLLRALHRALHAALHAAFHLAFFHVAFHVVSVYGFLRPFGGCNLDRTTSSVTQSLNFASRWTYRVTNGFQHSDLGNLHSFHKSRFLGKRPNLLRAHHFFVDLFHSLSAMLAISFADPL